MLLLLVWEIGGGGGGGEARLGIYHVDDVILWCVNGTIVMYCLERGA